MKNPFLKDEYLLPDISLNKMPLVNIPNIIEINEIENKTAYEIFSAEQIINEIKIYADDLKINLLEIEERDLPIQLNCCLESNDEKVKKTSEIIAEKFGRRLGIILYVLKRGKINHKFERDDWDEERFKYWENLENVVLTGGLSTGLLGKIFKNNIYKIFKELNLNPYNIHLSKNSQNLGLSGVSMYIKENSKANLVFDFGQSFIKRGIAHFNKDFLEKITHLEKKRSKYLQSNFDEVQLDKYFQKVIIDSYIESKEKNLDIGNEIAISIANYIIDKNFFHRGGYSKLGKMSNDYEKYLSEEIYKKTHKEFNFKLVHDGTAIAANFKNLNNSVSISLGTGFGIGFPNTSGCNKKVGK